MFNFSNQKQFGAFSVPFVFVTRPTRTGFETVAEERTKKNLLVKWLYPTFFNCSIIVKIKVYFKI